MFVLLPRAKFGAAVAKPSIRECVRVCASVYVRVCESVCVCVPESVSYTHLDVYKRQHIYIYEHKYRYKLMGMKILNRYVLTKKMFIPSLVVESKCYNKVHEDF